MKPLLEVKVNRTLRIITARMSGLFSEADMRQAAAEMISRTDELGGKRHIVVADMRGMKTVHPSIAAIMGEGIGYGRKNGCALCLHVSDDTVQRLQAARIGRQNAVHDDVTIDVDSPEEAQRLAREYQKYLDDPAYKTSIRGAIPTG
jgi:hypothetical protein